MNNLKEESEFFNRCAIHMGVCQKDLEELQVRIRDNKKIPENFKDRVSRGIQIAHLVQVMIFAEYADISDLSVFFKDKIKNL